MNRSRYENATHEFEEFVAGDAGAGPDTCRPERVDYCRDAQHGFLAGDVSGRTLTVRFFALSQAAPVKEMTFVRP